MKRRSFVRNAAISVFGLPLVSKLPFSVGLPDSVVQQWLQQFILASAARRGWDSEIFSIPLRQSATSLPTVADRQPYAKESYTCYTYQANHSYCFYPLFLRHAAAGFTDLLLPVFVRDTGHTWRHFATLNTYQLEALARAGAALSNHQEPLQNLLLPMVSSHRTILPSGIFDTMYGQVSITTHLQTNSAITSIEVAGYGQSIFQETFVSNHNLTVGEV